MSVCLSTIIPDAVTSWRVFVSHLRWCTWARACVVSALWRASLLRAPVDWGTPWAWWEWRAASLPPSAPSNPHQSCCLRCLWPWPPEELWVGGLLLLRGSEKILGWKFALFRQLNKTGLLCCRMPTLARVLFIAALHLFSSRTDSFVVVRHVKPLCGMP